MNKPASQPCLAETVQVVALDGPWAWVEAEPKSACGGCSAHKVCGNGAMASLLSQNKKLRFKVHNDFEACLKEWVVIGWQGGSFLKTVAKTYLVPSLLCILLACLGGLYSEGLSALGALVGMGAGLGLMSLNSSQNSNYEIKFLHRVKEQTHE